VLGSDPDLTGKRMNFERVLLDLLNVEQLKDA
jgi:hypothetical protein